LDASLFQREGTMRLHRPTGGADRGYVELIRIFAFALALLLVILVIEGIRFVAGMLG
jgi:hypothetical protein